MAVLVSNRSGACRDCGGPTWARVGAGYSPLRCKRCHVAATKGKPVTRCTRDGCSRKASVSGGELCKSHYTESYDGERIQQRNLPICERFWAQVEKTDSCWLWTGPMRGRYGVFGVAGDRQHGAHRWAYTQESGPIPEGLELDHLCRTPRCVRPSHLEAVTPYENKRRAGAGGAGLVNKLKTHCIRGHEFTADNLLPDRHGMGWRKCKTCSRARDRERYRLRLGHYSQ